MSKYHLRYFTVFGFLTIIGIFGIQIFWVKQAFNISEGQFENNITVALRQVAEKIAVKNKTQFLHKNPVIKVNQRLYAVQVNSEIDANLLEHFIKTTFEYFNIRQDVDYSIYSCETGELVYCNYIQSQKPRSTAKSPDLPVFNDIDHYFTVSFPNYPIVSLNNIPMWTITSLILILVVLFIIFALYIIFNQNTISKVQRDFINNMTHEFKTPIATISVIQQVISDPDIIHHPKRLTTYNQIIGEEINRLNDQVEKVLQISKLEKKQFELQWEDIDIHEIIEQSIFNFEHINHEKEVSFISNLEAIYPIIPADHVHFTNVVNNIIENAIKYSGDKVCIEISTQFTKNQNLILSIADNGHGIEKKFIKKIFDKFYRITKDNTHNVKGFGLGLFYVKQIVQAHQWDLEVDSELGKGTSFKISIPQKNNNHG
jgi:two-component system, OmpR family, phosphate regulon sensor histidine kinase PhoR